MAPNHSIFTRWIEFLFLQSVTLHTTHGDLKVGHLPLATSLYPSLFIRSKSSARLFQRPPRCFRLTPPIRDIALTRHTELLGALRIKLLRRLLVSQKHQRLHDPDGRSNGNWQSWPINLGRSLSRRTTLNPEGASFFHSHRNRVVILGVYQSTYSSFHSSVQRPWRRRNGKFWPRY